VVHTKPADGLAWSASLDDDTIASNSRTADGSNYVRSVCSRHAARTLVHVVSPTLRTASRNLVAGFSDNYLPFLI